MGVLEMAPAEAGPPASEVLVAVADRETAALLAYSLAAHGHRVHTVGGGAEAIAWLARHCPDLLVLDLDLVAPAGEEVLRIVRRRPETAELPVVTLGGRASAGGSLRALVLGADDHLRKPFDPRELVLRVQAVFRRARSLPRIGPRRVMRAGPISIDVDGGRVTVDGAPVALTRAEFRLLCALVERPGQIQNRAQLLERAWGVRTPIRTRTVDMHVRRLRQKLGAAAEWIETVRGFGYRFREGTDGLPR
jgi:two-component system phosphate regulon response regulator PhoB